MEAVEIGICIQIIISVDCRVLLTFDKYSCVMCRCVLCILYISVYVECAYTIYDIKRWIPLSMHSKNCLGSIRIR